MGRFVFQNLLLLVIFFAILGALLFPSAGLYLKGLGIANPFLFLVFFCQGANVDSGNLVAGRSLAKFFSAGPAVALALSPVLGVLAMALLGWTGDDKVGFLLMACMGPTLVSGTVISVQAGGDRATALALTIVLSLLSVFAIPFNLGWTLKTEVSLDAAGLLYQLLWLILVPALLGQGLRRWKEPWILRRKNLLTHGPVVLFGAVIFTSLSSQSESLRALHAGRLLNLLVPALSVHGVLLLSGYFLAKNLFRMEETGARSLAIVCSQKTLPVAVAVWSTAFASRYPLALLPPVVFHLGQIFLDGMIAKWWGKRRG